MTELDRQDDAALMRLRHGTPAEQAELAALAGDDPLLRDRIREWDRQDAALAALYDPVASEPVPAYHLSTLRRFEHGDGGLLGRWSRIAAAVALLSIGALGGAVGYHLVNLRPDEVQGAGLAGAAFGAYATYSPETRHPVEVAGSDEPHLSNWLSNRLGRRIAPPDLSRHGFTLMGGRVLPNTHGPAVLMLYHDAEGRRLALYVAPAPGEGESAFEFAQHDSARGYWWFDDELGCVLVGELDRKALRDISTDAYAQIAGT